MIFSHMARFIAILVLLLGVVQILMGLGIASGHITADVTRYGLRTTGALIDRGATALMFAVALGTLAEISFAMRKGGGQ